MWIADGWKDYKVLDTANGEKLERWGDYILIRPDPQVIWQTEKESQRPLSPQHERRRELGILRPAQDLADHIRRSRLQPEAVQF